MIAIARTIFAFAALPIRRNAERRLHTNASNVVAPDTSAEREEEIVARSALDPPYLSPCIHWRHGR
jgi:hypothetical protein